MAAAIGFHEGTATRFPEIPVPGKADARAIPKATGESQGGTGENRGRPEWRLLGKECTEMLDGGEPNCVPPGAYLCLRCSV